jgi:hypothetical protein
MPVYGRSEYLRSTGGSVRGMRKMIGAITAMLELYPDRVNPGSL